MLDSWIAEGIVPGAAIVVARAGHIAGEAHLGLARRAPQRSVTMSTLWSLAPLTRLIIATATLMLVERGTITLDDRISELLPESAIQQPITLRHLLTHTSGLPTAVPEAVLIGHESVALSDVVHASLAQPPLFSPGQAQCYSNVGYALLTEALNRVVATSTKLPDHPFAPAPLYSFVADHILKPLGLHTNKQLPSEWQQRTALVEDLDEVDPVDDWLSMNTLQTDGRASPALFGTAHDIATLADLFLPSAQGVSRLTSHDEIGHPMAMLSPVTTRLMTSIQLAQPNRNALEHRTMSWGCGWEVKGEQLGHWSGDLTSPRTFGYLSRGGVMIWADPTVDLLCVLLVNRSLDQICEQHLARLSNTVMAAIR
jgi:CubicO group peptidase (beta-lactamase class C family)